MEKDVSQFQQLWPHFHCTRGATAAVLTTLNSAEHRVVLGSRIAATCTAEPSWTHGSQSVC